LYGITKQKRVRRETIGELGNPFFALNFHAFFMRVKKAKAIIPLQVYYQMAIQYYTVKQFVEANPAFRVGGIRNLIFNEHINGLVKFGAVVRIGGKVLINQDKFFAWVESQNQGGK